MTTDTLNSEQHDALLRAAHELEAVADDVFEADPPEWLNLAVAKLHAIREQRRLGGISVETARQL